MVEGIKRQARNIFISIFVILWTCTFHYESLRAFYLNLLVGHELPKVKFLFPPAGWIMFYNVEDNYGLAEIYKMKNGHPELIDPHKIFETKTVFYDNIRRNLLLGVLSPYNKNRFCHFLEQKFPDAEGFLVTEAYYPSVIKTPKKKLNRVEYACH